MMKKYRILAWLLTVPWLLGVAVSPVSVAAQPDPGERVRELLDRFDARVDTVERLVEASRNPVANDLLVQARRLRDEAEAQFHAGNFDAAAGLATRALETLKQAEDAARRGGGPQREMEQLRRMVGMLRRRFDDTRRTISDLETRQIEEEDLPGSKLVTIYERQRDRTLALLEEAESRCSQTQQDAPDQTSSQRCEELIAMARRLYEQGLSLVPENPLLLPADTRQVDNQIREAREILERAQGELDEIEREIDTDNPALAPSIVARLRNLTAMNEQANNRLANILPGGGDPFVNRISTAMGIHRRAAELARTALRQEDETGGRLQEEFLNRLQVVESLESNIRDLLDEGGNESCLQSFQEARRLLEEARRFYEQGETDSAVRLLSQAATQMNRVFACAGANRSDTARLEVLEQLWNRFDRERDRLSETSPHQTGCVQMLNQADSLRMESERLQQAGNLDGAFTAINQAQKQLFEAVTCMGMDVPRIQNILDRLQDEFDRRHDYLQEGIDLSSNSAAEVLLSEAENLRNLSDTQESQGQLRQAVQTVGRAISTLSQVQSLVSNQRAEREREILENLQQQFDLRFARVEEIVNQLAGNVPASQPLNEAARLRQQSESSAAAGRIHEALSRIGRATQLLEQATRQAVRLRQ